MRGKPHELSELKCILMNPPDTLSDWIEEKRFPPIHDIILGRSRKDLIAELADNPDAVHVKDTSGRTALDWATARAQLSDMKLLINHGSCLNTMDVCGRTTVLFAVDSPNDNALRILLEAGANPNPEVPENQFRSSPLIAASFGGRARMIELLIEFGADINACNPEGLTAHQAVASMQNAECADILLTHGADLDHISNNGHTPLMTAIIRNNHDVLRLLICRCHTGRLKGPPLLPIIAEYADVETMSIVASSVLLLKQILPSGYGFPEALQSRPDYDENLDREFHGLVTPETKITLAQRVGEGKRDYGKIQDALECASELCWILNSEWAFPLFVFFCYNG